MESQFAYSSYSWMGDAYHVVTHGVGTYTAVVIVVATAQLYQEYLSSSGISR